MVSAHSDTTLTWAGTGTSFPAVNTSIEHSPELKLKISFCTFAAAAYRFAEPFSGNHALCWSLQLSQGGRDAACQPLWLSQPTLATVTARSQKFSSSFCCLFHSYSQITKSEEAGATCGSCSTMPGEKRVQHLARARCAKTPPTPKGSSDTQGYSPPVREPNVTSTEFTAGGESRGKNTTRDELSGKVLRHEQTTAKLHRHSGWGSLSPNLSRTKRICACCL